MDVTKNEQYLLCSDRTKGMLIDMEKPKSPYNIVDLPPRPDSENISCIKAHPWLDSMFAYGTNLGRVLLCDTRANSKIIIIQI